LKHLLPILFLLTFSSNLLVPIHSDWFFRALANRNILTEFFAVLSQNQNSHLVEIDGLGFLVRELFFLYGEIGVGIFQIISFFSIVLLLYYNLIKVDSAKELNNKFYYLKVLCLALAVGVIQYAQDIHPIHFCIIYILLFRLYLTKATNISNWIIFEHIIFAFLNLFACLIDFRILFIPFICLFTIPNVNFKNAKIVGFQYLFIVFVLTIFSEYRLFLSFKFNSYFDSLIRLDLIEAIRNSVSSGLTFDYAFLLLLLTLYLIVKLLKLKNISLFFVLLPICLISYFTKSLFALFLLFKCFEDIQNPKDRFISLNDAVNILAIKLAKLSYQGRVFILFSFIFVSIVSFLKNPITDELFPVKEVDILVENKTCPRSFDPKIMGYLMFRFNHLDGCSKIMSEASYFDEKNKSYALKPRYASTFSDYWR
jgi:hypothetical protein